jgi:hypothetical protein
MQNLFGQTKKNSNSTLIDVQIAGFKFEKNK